MCIPLIVIRWRFIQTHRFIGFYGNVDACTFARGPATCCRVCRWRNRSSCWFVDHFGGPTGPTGESLGHGQRVPSGAPVVRDHRPQGGVGVHLGGQKGARNWEDAEEVCHGCVIRVEVSTQRLREDGSRTVRDIEDSVASVWLMQSKAPKYIWLFPSLNRGVPLSRITTEF